MAVNRKDAESAELDGVKIYFQGGRGTGYSLEWESVTGAGVSRISSRKKKNIFRVFNAFRKKGLKKPPEQSQQK